MACDCRDPDECHPELVPGYLGSCVIDVCVGGANNGGPAGAAAAALAERRDLSDAGARHFVFSPATAGDDPDPVIDRLLGDLVPALREHARANGS